MKKNLFTLKQESCQENYLPVGIFQYCKPPDVRFKMQAWDKLPTAEMELSFRFCLCYVNFFILKPQESDGRLDNWRIYWL
jgi:hypothetical protein